MPQVSSIDRLPVDIKSQLQQLLQDPRCTQLDATARINEILESEGHPERVTKSSVNRYAMRMEEVGSKLRQSREIADMYISRVGASPQGQTGLLINEMLRAMAFDLTLRLQDADISDPESMTATIDQLKSLALGMQRLEQSATINVKRETEIKKQAFTEAADKAAATAKQAGISEETIQIIRRDVLRMAA